VAKIPGSWWLRFRIRNFGFEVAYGARCRQLRTKYQKVFLLLFVHKKKKP
jgi:hypothetical protein